MDGIINFFSHPALSGIAALCSIVTFFITISEKKIWALIALSIFILSVTFLLRTIPMAEPPPIPDELVKVGKITQIKEGYVVFSVDSVLPDTPKLYVKLRNADIIPITLSKQYESICSATVKQRINEIRINDRVLIRK